MNQERDQARTHIAPSAPTHDDDLAPGRGSRSSQMHGPAHPMTGGLIQRKAHDHVHAAAARGIASPATALPFADQIQASFGPRHDVSSIQAHLGGVATDAAFAMGASAYATGNHTVFAGAPDLHTAAHEAAHVVQQAHGVSLYGGVGQVGDRYEQHADAIADRVVAGRSAADLLDGVDPNGAAGTGQAGVQRNSLAGTPDTDFAPQYRPAGKVHSHLMVDYGKYKASLSPTRETSMGGGHMLTGDLTQEELLAVFDGVDADLQQGKVAPSIIEMYLDKLNQAFRVLKIDTVEAQASYIANAYVESDQFRYMTETSAAAGSAAYADTPAAVKLDEGWLNEAALGHKKGVSGYEAKGSINTGDWKHSFIGRGPIQVTHRHFYVQAIAVLEHRAEELAREAPDSQDLKDVREAVEKIKKDPAEAANPKYAFLFSAAFMKMPQEGKKPERGDEKANRGLVTNWMGPQFADKEKIKNTAYKKAYDELLPRSDVETQMYEKANSPSPAVSGEESENSPE